MWNFTRKKTILFWNCKVSKKTQYQGTSPLVKESWVGLAATFFALNGHGTAFWHKNLNIQLMLVSDWLAECLLTGNNLSKFYRLKLLVEIFKICCHIIEWLLYYILALLLLPHWTPTLDSSFKLVRCGSPTRW